MLFLGTYPYSMDERGRLPIPPRFRDAFLSGVILTQGSPDKCVRIYPLSGFQEKADLYMAEPVTRRLGRLMRRSFFSTAYDAQLDRQGRVLVPTQLRRWASLDGEVVVIGIGDGIEVWDERAYEEARAAEESELEALESES
jgi:MraZ protein